MCCVPGTAHTGATEVKKKDIVPVIMELTFEWGKTLKIMVI